MNRKWNKSVVISLGAFALAGPLAIANETTTGMNGLETQNAANTGEQSKDMGLYAPDSEKTHAYEGSMKKIPHVAISFDKGSSLLTESARASLRDLVKNAGGAASIDEATVAAWSDKKLPAANRELNRADRDLATKRADAIASVLRTELEVKDVDTFSMAERANWLARTFDTREAELKSIFGQKGSDAPVTNAEFQVIKNEGGPSEAVVVLEPEDE